MTYMSNKLIVAVCQNFLFAFLVIFEKMMFYSVAKFFFILECKDRISQPSNKNYYSSFFIYILDNKRKQTNTLKMHYLVNRTFIEHFSHIIITITLYFYIYNYVAVCSTNNGWTLSEMLVIILLLTVISFSTILANFSASSSSKYFICCLLRKRFLYIFFGKITSLTQLILPKH